LTPESELPERRNRVWLQIKRSPLVILGIFIIVSWLLIGVSISFIAPYNPQAQNVNIRKQEPDSTHWFGTDELGRDVFTRVLYGTRVTLPAGLAVVIVGSAIGTLVGSVAGYLGGFWDELMMRFTELFMAFPAIILALAITAALGPAIRNAVIALVIVSWPNYARLVRGLVLETKSREFVEAVRSVGGSGTYILFRTILPNSIAPTIVYMTLDIGNAILAFAALSFIGLGPDPSSPEWGRMVSIGINNFDEWWMWLFPGLAIATAVMALNFIGDGLRDIADPRTR
jgi:peptide/nickel transport system permease protein